MKLRLLAAVSALALTLVVSCSDLVAGDSLVVQAATGVDNAAGLVGESTVDGVTLKGIAGTAPCDYKSFVAADYNKYRPKKVSLAFSGNNGTACMTVGGARLTGQALANKYHDDLVFLTKFLASKAVRVIYSAPLCKASGAPWANGDPSLRAMESGLAYRFRQQGYHVAYSDYAAQQICPGWAYVPAYRSVDGLHLSPAGVTRYAAALRFESKNTNP